MEPRLHQRLQELGHHRLRDSVRDRRHAQHTKPAAMRLGDHNCPDRRGNQVPELIRFQTL